VQVVARGFVQVRREAPGVVGAVTREDVAPPAPFAAVEVDLDGNGGVLVAGLTTVDGDGVLATCDTDTGRVTIELTEQGRSRTVRRTRADLDGVDTFAFALCERQVTVLVRSTEGWRPVLTERRRLARRLDLRDPAALARHGYTWGVRSGRTTLAGVRAGLFGMTGLRDPHLVQHADGTPYVEDGRVLVTWTCAGLGGFAQAHWGVFAHDLDDPTRMEQVAQIFSRRDGLVLGDHAGQLVRDGDRWHVVTSGWGDFGERGARPHLRHLTTYADLLHGVHVVDTEPTPLPTEHGSWDAVLTRVDGRWLLGFVESPSQRPFDFHPALAATDDPDPWTGLRLAASAPDLHQTEGPVLARLDGRWRLLASDGHAREFPVFDLDLRRVGTLPAPYLSNIPHPQVLERPDRPGSWWLLTFDGTRFDRRVMGYGGHGDVVVMSGHT